MTRLSLLVALIFVLPAQAQSLSLVEAERLWESHSHELQLAQSAVQGAAADLQTADRLPNPAISLNAASVSPQSGYGSGHLRDKRMDSILRVEQLIERGNKRELRRQGAEAQLAAATFERDDTRRQQLAALRKAYHDLHFAQERLALTQAAAELHEKTLQAARKRQQAGDLAPVDVSRLAVDKARTDSELGVAQGELAQAQLALAYLIGQRQAAATLVASDPWPEVPALQPLPASPLRRPDLLAGEQRLRAAEADRDMARALRQRDVSVGFQLERNLQNAPTNSFGVGISIPLFAWHEYEGEIARAESDFNSAQLQFQRQQALLQIEQQQLFSALQAAGTRLRQLSGPLLEEAERVAQAAELAYSKGAMGLLDLLDARRTLRQLQLEAAGARVEHARLLVDWQLLSVYANQK